MLHLPELQPAWCLLGCFERESRTNEEQQKINILYGDFILWNGLHRASEKGTICSIGTCMKYRKIQKEGVRNGQDETADCIFNGD